MTDTTGRFTLNRSFPLTPDQLWHLLTDPTARTEWSGPSDDVVLILTDHDVREGGKDHQFCGPKEAPEFAVETHWYRLDGPAFACFTETLEFGGEKASVSLVTYVLEATDTGTDLTTDVTVASLVGEDMTADHKEGWTSALDRLSSQIAEGQGAAAAMAS